MRTVTMERPDGGVERVATKTVIWAAGITASDLAGALAEVSGAELDRAGRVAVEPDLTLPRQPEVFARGDMVRARRGDGTVEILPGVAPLAMQQGRYAAKVMLRRLRGTETTPSGTATRGISPLSAGHGPSRN
jgi:NADH:ubiquinone reductase (H+-translocating)